MRSSVRRLVPAAVAALALAGLFPAGGSPASAATLPSVGHVWVVVLENESSILSGFSGGGYLASTLRSQGAYIPNYYAVAHQSAPNYIAMISGEGPNADTQGDCQVYREVSPSGPENNYGQEATYGGGCVYKVASTLAGQLGAVKRTWKGYMEDMGLDPTRDGPVTCKGAAASGPGTPDPTQSAQGPYATQAKTPADQYALRHDPFMYFHSIVDTPQCATNVVQLQDPQRGLQADLASVATTPNFSLVVPNLCDDGHDNATAGQGGCAGPDAAGRQASGGAAVEDWLTKYVPAIVDSPAFRRDGMLVITYDELDKSPNADYAGYCCNEQSAFTSPTNAQYPGIVPDGSPNNTSGGSGGGQVGAVVLSPFVRPGTVTQQPYNHYSLLRTVEDIFHTKGGDDGNGHLGFAGSYPKGNQYFGPCQQDTPSATAPCQADFSADVFSDPTGSSFPVVDLTKATQPTGPIVLTPPGASGSSGLGAALPDAATGLSSTGAAATGAAPLVPPLAAAGGPDVSPLTALRPLAGPALSDSGASPLGLLLLLVLTPLAAVSGSVGLFRRRTGG